MVGNLSKTSVIRHIQRKYSIYENENITLMLHTIIILGWRRDALSACFYFIYIISRLFSKFPFVSLLENARQEL